MLFNILVAIARIYLGIKFLWVLIMNQVNPENYPLESLQWFLYFMIFDIWLHSISRNVKMNDDEEGKDFT
jgi:hypothetical protein